MRSISILFFLLLASVSVLGQSRCPDGSAPIDRPLEITEKPKAGYPKDFNASVQGTITLRVEFLSNSQIGRISVVKGLPHGLTEQAVQAARKIKFKPRIKDCVGVDSFLPVSYSFSHY